MYIFSYRADHDRADEARSLIEQWWNTEHSSPARYLLPGHMVVVDGRLYAVMSLEQRSLTLQNIHDNRPHHVVISSPDQLFRHPVNLKDAHAAIAALPGPLHSAVNVVDSEKIHA